MEEIYQYNTSDLEMDYPHPTNDICQTFIFKINTSKSKIYRDIKYSYHPVSNYVFTPKDLKYNLFTKKLSWIIKTIECMPQIFYVLFLNNRLNALKTIN